MGTGTRRQFSREFKLEAVRLVKERGVSVAQASRDLDVHENVLRKWLRELAADPQQAFPGKGVQEPEAAEIVRLKTEVAKLKMERDILKKAAASGSTCRFRASCICSSRRWMSLSAASARGSAPAACCTTSNRNSNLAHVALDTDYPDSTHFSHSIRQVYGLKPKDIFARSRRLAIYAHIAHP